MSDDRVLIAACKLTLLFHAAGLWDAEKSLLWDRLTMEICEGCGIRYKFGYASATTRVLCDMQRAALVKVGAE